MRTLLLLTTAAALITGCKDKDASTESGEAITPVDGEACLTCHDPIEQAHPTTDGLAAGDCTPCHGGDGEATDKELAHVLPPSEEEYDAIRGEGKGEAPVGYLKDLAPDQLDQFDPAYVRFINPGDIRANEAACGECHPEQVANQRNSVMTTNAGHYMPTLYYGDFQDQDAIYGSFPATDPECDPAGVAGSVCELETLPPAPQEEIEAAIAAGDWKEMEEDVYGHYLAKSCNTCHAAGYGFNDSPHLYRSTGCSACHMLYDTDGVYLGDDPTIPRGLPVHVARHELTSAIPTEQCATCHFQGGRIGLNFRGIRESGFVEDAENIAADCDPATTTCMEPWAESAYRHEAGYYVLDEDTSNDVDETPPDLHYAAGMHCADCHVGADVHGDGRIYSTSKGQLDIACTDCHGDPRQKIEPDSEGVFRTANGKELPQLSLDSEGAVILTGVVDGEVHRVPQPADYFEGGYASASMQEAMGVDGHGWSHTDSLTCDACHNSWQLFCIGCHITFDMRFESVDQQTGLATTGAPFGFRQTYSLDTLLLAQGVSGKAQPTNPSQHVQMAVIDQEGTLLMGEWVDEEKGTVLGTFRENPVTDVQAGFAPFFQHTATSNPRPCETCHRTDDSEAEMARVKGVYGYGTGEFILEHPGGTMDPTQFLDEGGNLTSLFVHPGTGPLAPEVLERALGVNLSEKR